MRAATDFETWHGLAVVMDQLHGRDAWKDEPEDPKYHSKLVNAAIQRLRRARTFCDYERMIETLKPCMVKNFGGAMNTHLYSQTHAGTKRIVEELFVEIRLCFAQSLSHSTVLHNVERKGEG